MSTSPPQGDADHHDHDAIPTPDTPGAGNAGGSRSLRKLGSDLWRQKPGPRAPRSTQTATPPSKQVVDGLSHQEWILGIVATVLDVAVTVFGYFADERSHVLVYHREATSLLLAGLVGGGLMALGTLMRRRALLGFASFIVGMEMISFAGVQGILFLAFGGWLIVRVMRKQKQDQAAGRSIATVDPARRRGPGTSTPKAPSASKRYTPPRGARAASGRRR